MCSCGLLDLTYTDKAVSVPQDDPICDDAGYSELLEFFLNLFGTGFMPQLNGSSVSVGNSVPFKDCIACASRSL